MSYLDSMYLKQKQTASQGRGASQARCVPRGGGQSGGGQSGGGQSGGGISGGGGQSGAGLIPQCVATTPATTVEIQPPPFILSIPGPLLYAASQPLAIQQQNPCIPQGGRGGGRGGGQGGGQKSSFFFEEYPADLMLEAGMGPRYGCYSVMDLPYHY